MTLTKNEILNSARLPARLDVTATSTILNFPEHDIPVLISAKLLEPLGSPSPNAPKYFATTTIQAHAEDAQWLSKATRVVSAYWRKKRSNLPDGANDATVPAKKKSKTGPEKPSTDSSTESSIMGQ